MPPEKAKILMKPKPPPTEEHFDEILYGNDSEPAFASMMPTFKQDNFKVLLRVGSSSFWFLPRSGSNFLEIDKKTTRRPESSLDISNSQEKTTTTRPESSLDISSSASIFKYKIRLLCSNNKKKKCRAKVNMLLNVNDKFCEEFFYQEIKLERWENFEEHCKSCFVEDPYYELLRAYCDNFNLQNRTNPNMLSQQEVRDHLCNQLEMSDVRAAQLFNRTSNKTMNNKASAFQQKIKENLPVSKPTNPVPDHLENLPGAVKFARLRLACKSTTVFVGFCRFFVGFGRTFYGFHSNFSNFFQPRNCFCRQ
jgi:hypothetical protein